MTSQCQNCDWRGPDSELGSQIEDTPGLLERVSPGEPMPTGECPVCGALCQPVSTMTPDEGRRVVRAPVLVGERRVFYSEMQQEYEPPEKRLRQYTGQEVTVVRHLTRDEYDGPGPDDADEDFETSRVFEVRADDGFQFHALAEELNGWDRDLGQYFWPDATYGPDHDTQFLRNERAR